jgi:hypothetical protein
MLPAVAAETEFTVQSPEPAAGRAEVLARYEHLRDIGRRHISRALALVTHDALNIQARRLHLDIGHVVLLDRVSVWNFVYDLAVHTAEMGRSRAIERYARSARVFPGSDDALVLDALCRTSFTIFRVQHPHRTAGWIAKDVLRDAEFWMIDDSLESAEGSLFAGRIYRPDLFSIRAGPRVECEPEFLGDVADEVPQLRRKSLDHIADDPRFAQALYCLAIASQLDQDL